MSITVTNLLWDDARGAGESLARRLRKTDVSGNALAVTPWVNPRAYPVLDERIAEALRGAVEVDLGSVVIAAWTGYQHLRDAARRTLDGGPPEDVVLGEHEIASTHQPVVDILVNGSSVNTLTFELTLSLALRAVIAVVDGGRLVALRGGQVAVEARLELGGAVLAKGKRTCLAGALVELGHGVQLVNPAPATASQAAPGPAPAAATATSSGPTWVGQMPAVASSPVPSQAPGPWWERTASAIPGPGVGWWKPGQGGQR